MLNKENKKMMDEKYPTFSEVLDSPEFVDSIERIKNNEEQADYLAANGCKLAIEIVKGDLEEFTTGLMVIAASFYTLGQQEANNDSK